MARAMKVGLEVATDREVAVIPTREGGVTPAGLIVPGAAPEPTPAERRAIAEAVRGAGR